MADTYQHQGAVTDVRTIGSVKDITTAQLSRQDVILCFGAVQDRRTLLEAGDTTFWLQALYKAPEKEKVDIVDYTVTRDGDEVHVWAKLQNKGALIVYAKVGGIRYAVAEQLTKKIEHTAVLNVPANLFDLEVVLQGTKGDVKEVSASA